ncbi:hypothetical protein [Brazilian marseillevirus]|uniref:hypothetical protein n=1 Tax=Brazilian marseillevirus TaxID=1813599 RepID=UPI0007833DDB|nr:hypothetical protein A3303_gp414 [Brazilian marseillevirus]AMQ10922.1 hypothetical protein [Brazilian marseillevirus]
MMDGFELNFAFMDRDIALREELRQREYLLKFSHNDIREALLSGRLDLVLWLRKWYEEHWVLFVEGAVLFRMPLWEEMSLLPRWYGTFLWNIQGLKFLSWVRLMFWDTLCEATTRR